MTEIPSLFPRLPVLERLVEQARTFSQIDWGRVGIVAVQHILESTGSLFESLLRIGVHPGNICLLGKAYSSNDDVRQSLARLGIRVLGNRSIGYPGSYMAGMNMDLAELWQRASEEIITPLLSKLIIIDDGGRCLASMPPAVLSACTVLGVEQTTSGIQPNGDSKFSTIEVATSAAKRLLEPSLISRAVLSRVRHYLLGRRATTIGVVGYGYIGRAIAHELIENGFTVWVCDKKSDALEGFRGMVADTVEEMLNRAEVIFGCTGTDITEGLDLSRIDGWKTLISCSSEDKEFRSLIRRAALAQLGSSTALGTLSLSLPNGNVDVLRGGFPINFDGSPESVPSSHIQVTRGLLLGAVMQAAVCDESKTAGGATGLMLDPLIQRDIVNSWFADPNAPLSEYNLRLTRQFNDPAWITKESGGTYATCDAVTATFG